MKKSIETIREGFLKATGARLLDTLMALLIWGITLAIGLLLRGSIGWKTLSVLCLLSMAPFGLLWWRSLRRIRILEDEVSYLRNGILIYSARYGAGETTVDVTPYLRQQIAKGYKKIPVGNSLLGGKLDPCPNVKKQAVVEFSRPGKREVQTIMEDRGEFDFT
jgi:hypothetical protein